MSQPGRRSGPQLPAGRRRQAPPKQQWRPWHRRTLWILGSLIAFFVVVGIAGGGEQDTLDATPSSSSTSPSGMPVAAPAAAAPQPDPEPEPAGEVVEVARVVDGDTFELADGRTVRVLGIDSCEMKAPETYGGELAKSAAEGHLSAGWRTITLTTEPGVDTDRDGRLLRYVQVDGDDFGVHMVKNDHTGVYQNENDASDAYVEQLYAHDLDYAMSPPSGRECADPYPPAPSSGTHVDIDDDDDGLRDGALTGGYCARKWWC